MPLLDHFHRPLSQRRHWQSFHSAWATALADALNNKWLPDGYFAEEMITFSKQVEIDIASFADTWAPPEPDARMPGVLPDSFFVKVYSSEEGPTLVGSVELVSPANKDREAHRQAFAIKCAGYLQQGVGVVIVDIVTSRRANLHNDIVQLLGQSSDFRMDDTTFLYSAAYGPATRGERAEIDLWRRALALGSALPAMPIALTGAGVVCLDLESAYDSVCQRRLPA